MRIRGTNLEFAAIGVLTLVTGTAYILATGKLDFFVKPDRYANSYQCRRAGGDPEQPNDNGGSVEPPEDPEEYPRLAFEEVREAWTDGSFFIDARPPADYRKGHVPGAVSIPAFGPRIEEKIQALLDREVVVTAEPVVVYCTRSKDCEASRIVCTQLRNFEFLDISIYDGGFPEWNEKKMAVHEGEERGPQGPDGEGPDGEGGGEP
ncbi:MAG: rhodanese-like domain-containing protein [Planctomycetota bacterium]|nr:rhodanese-like domain-containing protein [Planctomycetota bacterium]